MKHFFATLCALTLLSGSLPARADEAADSTWYMGNSGDLSIPKNSSVTGTATGSTDYGFSSGGNLMLGYRLKDLDSEDLGMRVEVEGGYHALGLDSVTVGGVPNANPKGDLGMATLMANAYYDVKTGTAFTPYIGAGIGGARISFPSGNGFGNSDSSDYAFAYQGMAGISYAPDFLPSTEFFAGYRYLGSSSPEFSTAGGHISLDNISTHNIEGGFRYNF